LPHYRNPFNISKLVAQAVVGSCAVVGFVVVAVVVRFVVVAVAVGFVVVDVVVGCSMVAV